jgi:hypothetical protein
MKKTVALSVVLELIANPAQNAHLVVMSGHRAKYLWVTF